MNELREMIDEIRRIRNVQPGDQMAANEHFGYLGQLLENLIYAFDSADQSWQEVEDNPVYTLDKTGQRVFSAGRDQANHQVLPGQSQKRTGGIDAAKISTESRLVLYSPALKHHQCVDFRI